jgi:hypothetical protein
LYQFPCDSTINERQAFCQTILSVNDKFEENLNLIIYPNPTNGTLTIDTKISFEKIKVSIYTIMGQKIFSSQNQIAVDFSELPTGIYFVSINIDGKTKTERIIKK